MRKPSTAVAARMVLCGSSAFPLKQNSHFSLTVSENWHYFRVAIEQRWHPDNYFGDECPFVLTSTVIGNVSAPKTASERILAGQEQLKD